MTMLTRKKVGDLLLLSKRKHDSFLPTPFSGNLPYTTSSPRDQ
jgi:hypothetical protein